MRSIPRTGSSRTSDTSLRRTVPLCARSDRRRSTGGRSRRAVTSRRRRRHPSERRAAWWYRLRGYRVLAANVWVAGNELDLIVRRGRTIVFCEVKSKSGDGFGSPAEMVTPEKMRRVRRAAEAWLAARPELHG